ncbi:MAG: TonB-dependent receptor [Bacteroidetes bacterium]|nr:TonB-dependent receptor [Bacteroidota bacterium]
MFTLKHPRKFRFQATRVVISFVFLVIAMFFALAKLQAQNTGTITVKGTVTDQVNKPLSGVSIAVLGKTIGTTTDANGLFTINVSGNDVLSISHIGYTALTVDVNDQTDLKISLTLSGNQLNDVIVVGYGTQKKADATGAVTTINTTNLVNRPVTSVTNAMQGQVPGMTIISRGGNVGSDIGTINVRGRGNLGSSSPLYVVDGVPVSSDVFARINPSDIANISILKDASAAIYGSRAAYGVILVTTKNGGSSEKMTVGYNAYYGSQSAILLPDYVGSYEFAQFYNEANINAGALPTYSQQALETIKNQTSPDSFPDNNWYKLALRSNAPIWQNELTIAGGGKTRYYISGSVMRQASLIPNNALTRYSFRTNVQSKVSKILTVGSNIAFIRDEIKNDGGSFSFVTLNRLLPLTVNKQTDGTWGSITGGQINSTQATGNVVRTEQEGGHSTNNANRFLGSVNGTLTPFKGFNVTGSFSYNVTNTNSSTFKNYMDPIINFITKTDLPGTGQVSSLSDNSYIASILLSQVYGSYERSFGNHFGKILVGTSYESDYNKSLGAYRDEFASNDLNSIDAGAQNSDLNNSGSSSQRVIKSYFGRFNYSFRNKYLLEFNMRADASSQFAPGHRWGYFPSVSGAWKISDESFMRNIDWINELKLRVSWGQLGNVNNVGYYDYLDALSVGTVAVLGSNPSTGVYPTSAANPNLTWEVVDSKNIGLDADLFNHQLNVQVDLYDKLTKNILLQLPQPQEYGYQVTPSTNAGKVRNKGIEIQLTHNGTIGDLQYSISGNMTKIWNTVVDLAGQDNQVSGYYIYKQGASIGAFYMYRALGLFVDSAEVAKSPAQSTNTVPGDIKYADISGPDGVPDGIISSYDRTIVGNDVPYFNYGLSLSLKYKNFDFLMLGQGVGGVKVYLSEEASQAFFNAAGVKKYVEGRWTTANPNPNAVYPRLLLTANNGQNLQQSSFWLFNADYFRFKTISLGYTFPATVISPKTIQSLRLYFSSNNLFTIRGDHRMKDFDPEAPSSRAFYPQVKTYSFGVNVTF